MLLPLLAVMATAVPDSGRAFSGRDRQLAVAIPRLAAAARVDGVLDEAVWAQAARLTGFSQYQPVDSRPAEDDTEILVWYAPDAIWFGVRADESHGDAIRATRANRDNIGSDDHVQILLDTYNDRRRAFLFGVNPFGVQQDGTRSDQFSGGAGGMSGGGGGVGFNFLDGNVDLNPDYVFESRGRLVPGGYEVEIRIPFKSLRYQEGREQTWGINVLRRVQHSGFQDSWAPVVRASATFLGQSGTLEGLHDLHRGLVLELTPFGTQRLDGGRDSTGWAYDGVSELGFDARWGITQNLSLNGTWQPDFSQVEADVGQVLLNERFALFYPEKRPFFLDGLEQFDTPNQLIYTRRIGDPDLGVKLAGKVGGTNVGVIAARDGQGQSLYGEHPLIGAARLRTDLGASSTAGLVATAREDGDAHSRLVGADLRIVHSRLYFLQFQAVGSWARVTPRDSLGQLARDGAGRFVYTPAQGQLYQAMWDRTGRNWGFNYSVTAVSPDFDAAVGFVNRTDVVHSAIYNRLTGYGASGALVQTYGTFIALERIWPWAGARLNDAMEGSEAINPTATLRGGWQIGGSLQRAFFSFHPGDYEGYEVVEAPGPVPVLGPFAVPGQMSDLWSGSLRVTTPTWRRLTASASVGAGATPIFAEATRGRAFRASATLDLRPAPPMRVAFQVVRLHIERSRDGSRFSTETIPRLKMEYQLSRAVFVRFVGQYTVRERAALLDAAGRAIAIDGVPATATSSSDFRMDWLFSYRPVPGTLVYLGYGSTLAEGDAIGHRDLRRASDGFFGKVSYLLRL
jgi:hypothetical protein